MPNCFSKMWWGYWFLSSCSSCSTCPTHPPPPCHLSPLHLLQSDSSSQAPSNNWGHYNSDSATIAPNHSVPVSQCAQSHGQSNLPSTVSPLPRTAPQDDHLP